ncbi:MAG: protein kinase [Firmicutes bacterium]|nr:protein kinase [Bacillota bacterium]
MALYCDDCGFQNRDDAKFCNSCGFHLTPHSPAHSHSAGPVLLNGRYKIIREVKSGAMGCVYKAEDTALDNVVAVKMLFSNPGGMDSQDAEEHFQREARILAKLHHKGLPKVIDYFSAPDLYGNGNVHYLVMTFVEGEDLESYIKHERLPLPVEKVLDISFQILDILKYLHSEQPAIIYRDIKPSNIMLSGDKVFLVDFGIARVFSNTHQGTMVGTPGYAPPEQYKGFTDKRSDIYSLGVLMHYLLTGIDPENPNVQPFTFRKISGINTKADPKLCEIVEIMVNILPDKRLQSVEDVIKHLNRIDVKTNLPIWDRIIPLNDPVLLPYSLSLSGKTKAKEINPGVFLFISAFVFLFWMAVISDDSKCERITKDGIDLYNKGQYRQSVTQYTTALDIKKDPLVYRYRAYAWLRLNETEMALLDFKTAAALLPEDSTSLYYIGVLQSGKDNKEALGALNKAISIAPEYKEALFARGCLLLNMGSSEQAYNDFKKLFQLDPKNRRYFAKLAESGYLNKDYKSALFWLESADKIEPEKSNEELMLYAKIYIGLANPEKALEYLNQASKQTPVSQEISYLTGLCYEKMKNYEIAGEFFRKGLLDFNDDKTEELCLNKLADKKFIPNSCKDVPDTVKKMYACMETGKEKEIKTLFGSSSELQNGELSRLIMDTAGKVKAKTGKARITGLKIMLPEAEARYARAIVTGTLEITNPKGRRILLTNFRHQIRLEKEKKQWIIKELDDLNRK